MSEKTLLQMDNQEFLGKVDQLFEWLQRQAGEGPIEGWTLNSIQSEVRRRIMEQNATAPVADSAPVQVRIEPETYRAQDSKAELILYRAAISRGGFQTQVIHGLNRREADLLLNTATHLTLLGVSFDELPAPLRFW